MRICHSVIDNKSPLTEDGSMNVLHTVIEGIKKPSEWLGGVIWAEKNSFFRELYIHHFHLYFSGDDHNHHHYTHHTQFQVWYDECFRSQEYDESEI